MNFTSNIAVTPQHLAMVVEILHTYLPPEAKIAAFGSRVTGRNRQYSDLDLLIDAGRPLTLSESGDLRDAFSESDLPWKVDFIDRHSSQDYFLRLIEPDCVPLTNEG